MVGGLGILNYFTLLYILFLILGGDGTKIYLSINSLFDSCTGGYGIDIILLP